MTVNDFTWKRPALKFDPPVNAAKLLLPIGGCINGFYCTHYFGYSQARTALVSFSDPPYKHQVC